MQNRTFDEIAIGDSASLTRSVAKDDVELFAAASGNFNPIHLDESYAREARFAGIVAHSMWSAALISSLLGNRLPGPGTVYLGQDLRFHGSVIVGDTVTVTVRVREKHPERRILLDCRVVNQDGKEVLTGTAEVLTPIEKLDLPQIEAPEARVQKHDHYEALIARCHGSPAMPCIVAHPCDESSLTGAIDAAKAGLIQPILVGPQAKIREVAARFGLDITPYEIVDAPHSHAAAAMAVDLVRAGRGQLLMKGSLHTDELLGCRRRASETGLQRRSPAHQPRLHHERAQLRSGAAC